jgi:dsDNA-specific endonuclease/ATPase MutS2
MHFNIGNKVAVLDEALEGYIVDVQGNSISIKDKEGMVYIYEASELVLIKEDQHELSKFKDIHSPFLKEKMKEPTRKKVQIKEPNKTVLEVDLHIGQLITSTKGMDKFDILTYQLHTAKSKLEFAIRKRIPKVIFIHGVGEGVLKNELTYLFKKYPVQFYDASYQKYGFGATEVNIL